MPHITSLCVYTLLVNLVSSSTSPKRGLCYVPNTKHPSDDQIWVQPGSDLTWYYNYADTPTPSYSNLSQSSFEFVPMMWGVNGTNTSDTSFLEAMEALISGGNGQQGRNITHVLGFNEPNESSDVGGSDVQPEDAAKAWVANFEPLAEKYGVQLGLPACSGAPSALPWLEEFLGNCSKLVSEGGKQKNCTWDFLPVHWYDDFAGLASLIGERVAKWPGKEIWVTEYAFSDQNLSTSEEFFNQTIDYFDKESYIGRYSYFGAFRSDVSNVGSDVVFLSNGGKLTDIGSWYLGFGATGVNPQSGGGVMAKTAPGMMVLGMVVGLVSLVMMEV